MVTLRVTRVGVFLKSRERLRLLRQAGRELWDYVCNLGAHLRGGKRLFARAYQIARAVPRFQYRGNRVFNAVGLLLQLEGMAQQEGAR